MSWGRFLFAVGLFTVVAVIALVYARSELRPVEKRGSAAEEFVETEPEVRPAPKRVPWRTYAYDRERTHFAAGFSHRPPYRRLWRIDAHDTLEFPPSIGYGRVYLAQQKGLFFALNARTGRVRWRKKTKRCSASSPTIGKGIVYQAWMGYVPCTRRPASGFVIAWDADTGRKVWRFNRAPIESTPLLVRRTLYFGSWDHRVYAVNARTGRRRWSFLTDEEVNTSPAYWRGTIYTATDGGSLYALGARTGRLRWRARVEAKFGRREFFYATPTVAHGRVYIGNTDGTMYAYGARTGKLRWARPLGSYVYAAAAAWRKTIYVGTYDGKFYALDAATGDVRWKRDAPAAVHAAPTVMNGLVYYSTCSSCGSEASRSVKEGPDRTIALDARTGRKVWSFRAGKYASPIVADAERVYLTGRAHLFALEERRRGSRGRRKSRAGRRAVRRRAATRRARRRSARRTAKRRTVKRRAVKRRSAKRRAARRAAKRRARRRAARRRARRRAARRARIRAKRRRARARRRR